YAEVSGQTSGAAEEVTFNTITIDSTKTGNPYTDTTTWSGKNIDFNEEGTPITLTFTITNLSTGRPLYAKVTNTSSATNLNVQVDGEDFSATEWLELPAKTEGSTANTTTVVISLSVADDNESVTGNYGFSFDLKNELSEMDNAKTISYYENLEEGAITFTISNGEASVKGISSSPTGFYFDTVWSTTGNVVIPSYVKDNSGNVYKVTSVAYNAFGNDTLGSQITSISLPNTITTIGGYAFANCKQVTNVTIPASVTNIDGMAFAHSGVTNAVFSEGATYVGGFHMCNSLTNVTIPSSVKTIGSWAFDGSNLTQINLPEGLETISDNAFAGNDFTEIYIPKNVKNIGGQAFSNCTSLNNISIPDSVSTIGMQAFQGCTNLQTVEIKGAASIGNFCFSSCTKLEQVSMPNVTGIGESAFNGCTSLNNISIPDSISTIGTHAFQGCTGLTNLTIGTGLKSFGYGAFDGCTALETITIKAVTPPTFTLGTAFSGVPTTCVVYVPSGSESAYEAATYWTDFTISTIS
ncbi:MAG: leucine-rich repeat domain-containing protein, partial [Clostridiales bacterium]|nr:leucine-rich repeat domain-containing protein [Clostridiales bacterium]